jgi:hypothetical protein
MQIRRSIQIVGLYTLIGLIFCACTQRPVNFVHIKTVLEEDNSGQNTFRIVVPDRPECELPDLRDHLRPLQEASTTDFYLVGYEDTRYTGVELTWAFERPQQIPEQIERIKTALAEAYATDDVEKLRPFSGLPDPEEIRYQPNELAIESAPPLKQAGGTRWDLQIALNPVLLTSTEAPCRVPAVTYELWLPGRVRKRDVTTDIFQETALDHVTVERFRPNALRWTFAPQNAMILLLEEVTGQRAEAIRAQLQTEAGYKALTAGRIDEIRPLILEAAAETQPLDENRLTTDLLATEEDMALALLLLEDVGPTYTLTAQATTPNTFVQLLTRVIAPVLGVLSTLLALVLGLKKLRAGKQR